VPIKEILKPKKKQNKSTLKIFPTGEGMVHGGLSHGQRRDMAQVGTSCTRRPLDGSGSKRDCSRSPASGTAGLSCGQTAIRGVRCEGSQGNAGSCQCGAATSFAGRGDIEVQ